MLTHKTKKWCALLSEASELSGIIDNSTDCNMYDCNFIWQKAEGFF